MQNQTILLQKTVTITCTIDRVESEESGANQVTVGRR